MTYTGRILDSAGNPTGGRILALQLRDESIWYKDDRRADVIINGAILTYGAASASVNGTTKEYSITVDCECYLVIIPEVNTSNAKVISQGKVMNG